LKVADLIERDIERIALIETLESGKPISQARSEIEGAADLWRYAACLARTMHGDSHNSLGPDMLGLVLKEPIGVAGSSAPGTSRSSSSARNCPSRLPPVARRW
jgi:betaine-aldehyde dehydrogenase